MEISMAAVYACIAAGALCISITYSSRLNNYLNGFLAFRIICLRTTVPYIGIWSLAEILGLLLYVSLNCFSLYPYRPVSDVGLRAADLSLVNMIALYASPRLDSLASVLRMSLNRAHHFHFFVGIMSFI